MYYTGEGVPQDYVQAYAWFDIVASQGDKDVERIRDDLAKSMLPRVALDRAKELFRQYWEAYVVPFRN